MANIKSVPVLRVGDTGRSEMETVVVQESSLTIVFNRGKDMTVYTNRWRMVN